MGQRFRLRQLSHAHGAAGQAAAGRRDNLPAIAAKGRKVILGHGIFIHMGVHGRGNQLGTAAGQNRGGQHIIRQAVGQLGADIGGGRGNENQIRPVRQGDVFYTVVKIAVEGIHHGTSAGELLEGQRRNKFGGIFRHDHLHRRVLFHKTGSQGGCLIGGNAAGNAQKNGLSL